MRRKIPQFRSAEEERAFWAETGSMEYAGLKQRRRATARGLKLQENTVYLRLPGAMLEELRVQAILLDVPPHSLMKTYLAERIEREMMKERSGED